MEEGTVCTSIKYFFPTYSLYIFIAPTSCICCAEAATEFAICLIQTLVVNDSKVISELHHLVDALSKLAAWPGSPESLQQLVDVARNPATSAASLSGLTVGKEDRHSRDKKVTGHSTASREEYNVLDSMEPDPIGFREQDLEQNIVMTGFLEILEQESRKKIGSIF